jgi:hypothetical protein
MLDPGQRGVIMSPSTSGSGGEATKKYDLSYVPPGHRFTFELRLPYDQDRGRGEWEEVKRLLRSLLAAGRRHTPRLWP